MPGPEGITETAQHYHGLLEFVVFLLGIGGMMLSNWRGKIALENRLTNVEGWLKRLTKHVRRQNGAVAETADQLHTLETTCAATHGLPPKARPVRKFPGEEEEDDEEEAELVGVPDLED